MRTLIHLISEQTMQNLLPILALRPDRVISLRSPTERSETDEGTNSDVVGGSVLPPVARTTAPAHHFSRISWV
jgi:hypothetical protein